MWTMNWDKAGAMIVSDCEPDRRETTPADPAPWIGFERYFEFLSGKRALIADRTGMPGALQLALAARSADRRHVWQRGLAGAPVRGPDCGGEAPRRRGRHSSACLALGRSARDDGSRTTATRPGWNAACAMRLFEFEREFGAPCRDIQFRRRLAQPGRGPFDRQPRRQRSISRLEPGAASRIHPWWRRSFRPACCPTGARWPVGPIGHPPRISSKPTVEGRMRLWCLPMTTGPDPVSEPADRRGLPEAHHRCHGPPMVKLNLGFEPARFIRLRTCDRGRSPPVRGGRRAQRRRQQRGIDALRGAQSAEHARSSPSPAVSPSWARPRHCRLLTN